MLVTAPFLFEYKCENFPAREELLSLLIDLALLLTMENVCLLDFSEGHVKPLVGLIRSSTSQTFIVKVKVSRTDVDS